MKKSALFAFFTLLIFSIHSAYAQDAIETLKEEIRKDSSVADAIALYPENIRDAIFEVSQYPKTIVSLGTAQEKSSQEFKDLIKNLSQGEQKKVYDLVRYPKLVNEIAKGSKKSKAQLKNIVRTYPEEIRKTAVDLGENHYDLLVNINKLYKKSEENFKKIIKPLPKKARSDFETLVNNPEVLSLLSENLNFTVKLGQAYQQDPKLVRKRAASYGENLKEKNKKAMAEWNQGLDEDPQALEETQEAAEQFAKDNGYDTSESDTSSGSFHFALSLNPYPYWFGYPAWYATPVWRPYPLWYHTGWYYGPGRRVVWVGWPSRSYAHWYYRDSHRRYGSLDRYYNRHYDRLEGGADGFHHGRERRVSAVESGARPERAARAEPRPTKQARAPAPEKTQMAKSSQVSQRRPSRSYNEYRANSFHRQSWGRRGGSYGGGARGSGRGGGGRRR